MKPLKPLATNLTKSLALLFFITLVNCKDDNVTSDHIAEHQHPPIARFAIDDLPEIEQVIGQFSISRTSRTMNTTFGDLDLSDIVQYINTDGKYTYTFKIRNSQDLASGLGFENLHLIRLPDDNGYLAYIVRWQPNAEWYQNNDYLFNLGDFTGQASRFDLEYNHLSTTTFVNGSPIESSSDSSGSREMQIMCYDVVTCGCTGVPYYCDCTQPGCERNFSTACTTSGGSPINDNTDTGSTGTHIGGSGTGQPPYVPGGDADVIVESPTYDDFIELCLGESDALSNWTASTPYGQRKAMGIYLQDNTCSEEAQILTILAIENNVDIDDLIYVIENEQDYRNQMSDDELNLFDTLSYEQQTLYLVSAKQALDKTNELFPTFCERYNGKGDAFRHAYWNALSSQRIGVGLTSLLTTRHENRPPDYAYESKEVEMDLFNNQIGRDIVYNGMTNLMLMQQAIQDALDNGHLRYLTNLSTVLDHECEATFSSQLIPTNL